MLHFNSSNSRNIYQVLVVLIKVMELEIEDLQRFLIVIATILC